MIKCNKNVFEIRIKSFWKALQKKNLYAVHMPAKLETYLVIFFFAAEKNLGPSGSLC